tara:strand:- start:124 stop:486 length:363 start_codon:yes stop_codon:yes gene_type:complete
MSTWTIEQMDCENIAGQTNVVVKVHWKVSGADANNTCYCEKMTSFVYSTGDAFTPYADLTQAQVLGWVQDSLGTAGVTFYNNLIVQELATYADKFPSDTGMSIMCDANYVPETPTALPWD